MYTAIKAVTQKCTAESDFHLAPTIANLLLHGEYQEALCTMGKWFFLQDTKMHNNHCRIPIVKCQNWGIQPQILHTGCNAPNDAKLLTKIDLDNRRTCLCEKTQEMILIQQFRNDTNEIRRLESEQQINNKQFQKASGKRALECIGSHKTETSTEFRPHPAI